MKMQTLLAASFVAFAAALSPAQAGSPSQDRIAGILSGADVTTAYSQFRRGFRGRRGFYGRRYYGRPSYGRRYYRRGYGRGALIGGLAAGALIGGALAAQAQPAQVVGAPAGDATAYCLQRFKSYDPASGTYLGYDGQRHPCP